MINNREASPAVKLNSQIGNVFSPVENASYSHHPSIAFFNDRFFAIWSNGTKNEDDLGQRVLIAESYDGLSWFNTRAVVTAEMLGDKDKVLTAAGFYIHGDTLNLYYGSYNYSKSSLGEGNARPKGDVSHENTSLGVISTKDCVNWSLPKDLGIAIIPNHAPQRTYSGRLIISGNVMFPYTDCENGIDGYKLSGIYGDAFKGETPRDDSESIHLVRERNGWEANLICEGSFFQTDDNTLHMMLRSNSEFLWCADSTDDGKSWSAPYKTNYTDDGSKFHFGRLPDGRFYGVSNSKIKSKRNPLDLFISSDGENFDKHYILRDEQYDMQFLGLHKGGSYGYPHTLIHDGYMYVIYSKQKEAIEVTRISLSDL